MIKAIPKALPAYSKGNWKAIFVKKIENLNGHSLSCDVLQIKVLEPSSQKISTLAGTGTAGFKDGVAKAAQVVYLFTFFSNCKDIECVNAIFHMLTRAILHAFIFHGNVV